MAELIDALLSLSRLNRNELRRERVDLSALVREAVGRLSLAEPARSVDLVVPDHVTAEVDPVLARALIENLIGNAWKFTSKVPRARIELGACAGLQRRPSGDPLRGGILIHPAA